MGNEQDMGAVRFTWTFPEYDEFSRTSTWYLVAGIIVVALLIYAFTTRNFMFAVILAMLGVVVYLRHTGTPKEISCAIGEGGITCDGRFTPFTKCHEFTVIADAEHPMLSLTCRGVRPQILVPLGSGVDAQALRAFLTTRVTENPDAEEPGADVIGRLLKL